ncbi:MAG: tetratricopeptide repeat protein [Magnetococcales bacterium]|nr:tetratricopeptide repeat protein [Magnetococcales bacterium]
MGQPVVAILFLLATLTGTTPLLAEQRQALSRTTHEAMVSCHKLLNLGKHTEAIASLTELLDKRADQPYERAVILQSRAHAYLAQENHTKAIADFKRSLELNMLPDDVQQQLRYNLAQLYMMTQHYEQSVKLLRTWFEFSSKPPPEAYALLGSAYFQLNQYRQAAGRLRIAISQSQTAKENWYQGLLSAHYELKEYDTCETILQTMLHLFPHRGSLWRQLAGLLLMQEKYQQALPVMELAYLSDHLDKEHDLINLAQLYIHQGIPYKAGKLLEKEILRGRVKESGKNHQLLANAWLQAREKDRGVVVLKKVWEKSHEPKDGIRLARFYLETRKWEQAERLLSNLLNDGGLVKDTVGQAWLLLGIVHFELGSQEKSHAAFTQAEKQITTRKEAGQWLIFLKEIQRSS